MYWTLFFGDINFTDIKCFGTQICHLPILSVPSCLQAFLLAQKFYLQPSLFCSLLYYLIYLLYNIVFLFSTSLILKLSCCSIIFKLIFFWFHVLINLIHSTKHFWGILFCFLHYIFFRSRGRIVFWHAMFFSLRVDWFRLLLFGSVSLAYLDICQCLASPLPTILFIPVSSIQIFSLFWPGSKGLLHDSIFMDSNIFSPWPTVWEFGTEYHLLYCRLMEVGERREGENSVEATWHLSDLELLGTALSSWICRC